MVKRVARRVAVSTIHEEDFTLKDLSVDELKKLKLRVQQELTKRQSENAGFTKFEFENPDDRSYGLLEFTAKTQHGVLRYKCMVGHNYFDGIEITLDGNELEGEGPEIDEGEFGSSTGLNEAQEHVAEAVAQWAVEYGQDEAAG